MEIPIWNVEFEGKTLMDIKARDCEEAKEKFLEYVIIQEVEE